MKKKRGFLAGLFVFAGVVLGANQAQAVTQTLTFLATADNAYAIYTGTGTSATQIVGSALNFSSSGQIFTPENYTTTAQDTDWVYIAAWSDGASWQGFLADFTNTTTGVVLSGDSRWEVTATGINLNAGSLVPTLAELTAQIVSANAGANPSAGWKPITASALTNSQGGIHNVVVPGIAGGARWMWWNSGNQGGTTAPFSPGFNHNEYLIIRLPVNTTGMPDTTPPIVQSTNPANAANFVAINSSITAVFNESMDATTLNYSNIFIKRWNHRNGYLLRNNGYVYTIQ